MGIVSIVMIAVGLSMDAFAVSITNGILINDLRAKYPIKLGLLFGGFQALMPVLGYAAGYNFKGYIENFDHWIAFVLLAFIGGKMIYEALKGEDETELPVPESRYLKEVAVTERSKNSVDISENTDKSRIGDNRYLLMLAVATSIDALAVGVSFAFLQVSIVKAALLIGAVTFVICAAGVVIGKKFGEMFKKHAELAGGAILILIGLKILLEHLDILTLIASKM